MPKVLDEEENSRRAPSPPYGEGLAGFGCRRDFSADGGRYDPVVARGVWPPPVLILGSETETPLGLRRRLPAPEAHRGSHTQFDGAVPFSAAAKNDSTLGTAVSATSAWVIPSYSLNCTFSPESHSLFT